MAKQIRSSQIGFSTVTESVIEILKNFEPLKLSVNPKSTLEQLFFVVTIVFSFISIYTQICCKIVG